MLEVLELLLEVVALLEEEVVALVLEVSALLFLVLVVLVVEGSNRYRIGLGRGLTPG